MRVPAPPPMRPGQGCTGSPRRREARAVGTARAEDLSGGVDTPARGGVARTPSAVRCSGDARRRGGTRCSARARRSTTLLIVTGLTRAPILAQPGPDGHAQNRAGKDSDGGRHRGGTPAGKEPGAARAAHRPPRPHRTAPRTPPAPPPCTGTRRRAAAGAAGARRNAPAPGSSGPRCRTDRRTGRFPAPRNRLGRIGAAEGANYRGKGCKARSPARIACIDLHHAQRTLGYACVEGLGRQDRFALKRQTRFPCKEGRDRRNRGTHGRGHRGP